MRLITATLILLITLFPAVQADPPVCPFNTKANPFTYGEWHSSKIAGGGYILNTYVCPKHPSIMYCHSDVAGIFRSEDGGNTWKMVHGNVNPPLTCVRSISVDPQNHDNIIAAVGTQWSEYQGLYTSSDGGGSWEETQKAVFYGNGPSRSLGNTIVRDPETPQHVYACSSYTGFFKSTDNGKTWLHINGLDSLYISDVFIFQDKPSHILVSAEAKELGMRINGKSKREKLKGGLYLSADSGETWSLVKDEAPRELTSLPGEKDTLVGLFKDCTFMLSSDFGQTWTDWSKGIPAKDRKKKQNSIRALTSDSSMVISGNMYGQLYTRSRDHDAWQVLPSPVSVEASPWWGRKYTMGRALASITVDPSDQNHWLISDWYALYQTYDSGKNWVLTIDGIECTVIHSIEQDPSDPDIVHLGMADNGYFKSVNSGDSFSNIDWKKGITNNVKCISVSPSLPSRVYAVSTASYHWEANQVFFSGNKGETWKRSPMKGLPDKNKHHCNTITADTDDEKTVFITMSGKVEPGAGGVYKSTDSGINWTWIGSGLPKTKHFFSHSIWVVGRELAAGPEGHLVCISRDRSKYYYLKPDSGKWLASEGISGKPNSVAADIKQKGVFWCATTSGVFRTSDGGETWVKKLDKSTAHIAVDKSDSKRIAADIDRHGGVSLSTDSGNTWTELDNKLPYRKRNMMGFAGNRLIVGSGGNGAFWIELPGESNQ